MEKKFRSEMFFPLEGSEQIVAKQSAWYIRVKTAIAANKMAPFDIEPEVNCLVQDLILIIIKNFLIAFISFII